ncbi:hypothetical protein LZC95_05970 [Pendulispora brunnea]|uniref:Uncharacterized protein n=1 Tax=Pendulispora brunnea TaxID=2905690 RepID=A0ABZ2KGD7_9BACT
MPYVRQASWFLLPLGLAVVFLGAYAVSGEDRAATIANGILLMKLFALVGFTMATTRFSWGDRMHTVWILFVLNMVLLLSKDLLFGYSQQGLGLHLSREWQKAMYAIMVSIANIASTAATVLLARTWREAGLEISPSRSRQIAKLAVVPFAALLFVVGLRANLQRLPPDDMWKTTLLVLVPFGDLLCFSLIGPLAVTAFSLRGGALATPWAMYALGAGLWLVWDMANAFAHLSGVIVEVNRVLALGYTGGAGIAQWWVLRHVKSTAPVSG